MRSTKLVVMMNALTPGPASIADRAESWMDEGEVMIKKARLVLVLALCVLLAQSPALSADWQWAKGNLHAHTTSSDGDAEPQLVADWYKDHGYQFLVISDHGTVTDVNPLDKDPGDGYILISGEEVGMTGEGPPIHANAIDIDQTVKSPAKVATPGRSVRELIDYIRHAGGIPMVNHPNWQSSLSHRELLQIEGPYLLEIANMAGDSSNEGSLSRLSTEQTWDVLLSEGRKVYATATDDAHHYKVFEPAAMNPGRGWVVARVAALTRGEVIEALARGGFYASTGVELVDYCFDGSEFRISVVPKANQTYLIRFVGKYGRILRETVGTSARYRVQDKPEPDDYIRCKVICGDGTVAWTQAYRRM